MIQRTHEFRIFRGPDMLECLILQLSEFTLSTHIRSFQVRGLMEFALARFSDFRKLALTPFSCLASLL